MWGYIDLEDDCKVFQLVALSHMHSYILTSSPYESLICVWGDGSHKSWTGTQKKN